MCVNMTFEIRFFTVQYNTKLSCFLYMIGIAIVIRCEALPVCTRKMRCKIYDCNDVRYNVFDGRFIFVSGSQFFWADRKIGQAVHGPKVPFMQTGWKIDLFGGQRVILTELEHASKHSNGAACVEGSGGSWNQGETGMSWTTTEGEGCVTRQGDR